MSLRPFRTTARLIAMLAILVSAFTFTAAPVAATIHSCQPVWEGTTKQFYGNTTNSTGSSNTLTGVKATININTSTFRLCSPNYGNDMVTAWVSLQSSTAFTGNDTSILQVGIIRCNFSGLASCDLNANHFMWARGGCNGYEPLPIDLGVANNPGGDHVYEIRHSFNQYNIIIDGYLKASIPENHAAIDCWIHRTGLVFAGYFVETNDDGDGIADVTDKLNFTLSYFRYTDLNHGSWYIPNGWGTGACDFTENTQYLDGKCDNLTNPGDFNVWTEPL